MPDENLDKPTPDDKHKQVATYHQTQRNHPKKAAESSKFYKKEVIEAKAARKFWEKRISSYESDIKNTLVTLGLAESRAEVRIIVGSELEFITVAGDAPGRKQSIMQGVTGASIKYADEHMPISAQQKNMTNATLNGEELTGSKRTLEILKRKAQSFASSIKSTIVADQKSAKSNRKIDSENKQSSISIAVSSGVKAFLGGIFSAIVTPKIKEGTIYAKGRTLKTTDNDGKIVNQAKYIGIGREFVGAPITELQIKEVKEDRGFRYGIASPELIGTAVKEIEQPPRTLIGDARANRAITQILIDGAEKIGLKRVVIKTTAEKLNYTPGVHKNINIKIDGINAFEKEGLGLLIKKSELIKNGSMASKSELNDYNLALKNGALTEKMKIDKYTQKIVCRESFNKEVEEYKIRIKTSPKIQGFSELGLLVTEKSLDFKNEGSEIFAPGNNAKKRYSPNALVGNNKITVGFRKEFGKWASAMLRGGNRLNERVENTESPDQGPIRLEIRSLAPEANGHPNGDAYPMQTVPAFVTNAALALIMKKGVEALKARTLEKKAGFEVRPITEETLKNISYDFPQTMEEGVKRMQQGKMTQELFKQVISEARPDFEGKHERKNISDFTRMKQFVEIVVEMEKIANLDGSVRDDSKGAQKDRWTSLQRIKKSELSLKGKQISL